MNPFEESDFEYELERRRRLQEIARAEEERQARLREMREAEEEMLRRAVGAKGGDE